MFPDASSQNFVQLLSKACSGTIKQLLWCPTMDLLMLCTEDDQLALHRLNWQRLWVVQPEASVCSATWSSDGKMLAIGGTDGRIALVDSEQGDALRLHAALPDAAQPIIALHWQDVRAMDDNATQRPSTMAARLQAVCSAPPPPTPPPGFQRPSPYAPPNTSSKGTQEDGMHLRGTTRLCHIFVTSLYTSTLGPRRSGASRVGSIAHTLHPGPPHLTADVVRTHAAAPDHRRLPAGFHVPRGGLHAWRGVAPGAAPG